MASLLTSVETHNFPEKRSDHHHNKRHHMKKKTKKHASKHLEEEDEHTDTTYNGDSLLDLFASTSTPENGDNHDKRRHLTKKKKKHAKHSGERDEHTAATYNGDSSAESKRGDTSSDEVGWFFESFASNVSNQIKEIEKVQVESVSHSFSAQVSSLSEWQGKQTRKVRRWLSASFSRNEARKICKELGNHHGKVLESIKTLKRDVKDLDNAIELENASLTGRSPAALKSSKTKVDRLKAERTRTMHAIEYLQEVEIDMKHKILMTRESILTKTKRLVNAPCIFEIMTRVQTILGSHITDDEPGAPKTRAKPCTDAWYLDDPHKLSRNLTIPDTKAATTRRQRQCFPEPSKGTCKMTASGDPSRYYTPAM